MRKNKGLNPAHHEVKTILGDMLDPMYQSLLPLFDESTELRKKEMELGFRRVRATDADTQNQLALELKDALVRLQIVEAEIERKRTCIRAFLMYVGQKVNKVRRDENDPGFTPELSDYQQHLLGNLTDLEPRRYELA